nr:MAG TPA: hypothetical protein [Caudoviricetes sp.]
MSITNFIFSVYFTPLHNKRANPNESALSC